MTIERNKHLRRRPAARAMIPMAPFVAKLAGRWVYSIGDSSDPVRPEADRRVELDVPFIDELIGLFATRGLETFEGDRITTQTSHALQTAAIAEQEGAPAEMIVAALLHDIGRIINPKDREITDSSGDAKHEEVARTFLEKHFGPQVTMPIKWHVAAKRYLVATDPAYSKKISPGSTRSLSGQGGALSIEEARAFIEQPYAREGVTLRRWDDRAKSPDAKTPPIEHFVPYLRACIRT